MSHHRIPSARTLLLSLVVGGISAVVLTSATAHADDEAFVIGPTGIPYPDSAYLDWVTQGYLEPLGFTSTGDNVFVLPTYEESSGFSYVMDDQEVIQALLANRDNIFADGQGGTWLFGYSQSATVLSAVDSHLNDPTWLAAADPGLTTAQASDLAAMAPYLHLVMVGDPAADNPGSPDISGASTVHGFDNDPATLPWLNAAGYGVTDDGAPLTTEPGGYTGTVTSGLDMAGQNTNNDLSPTDVFTANGDNWAQSQWFFGIPSIISYQHLVYPGLTADDFDQVAQVNAATYYNASLALENIWADLWNTLSAESGYGPVAGADFTPLDLLWDAVIYSFEPTWAVDLVG